MQDLGTFGGTDSEADGISNSGLIVGAASTSGNATYDPFVHSGSGPLDQATDDIGTLGGWSGVANAINESGQVVGASRAVAILAATPFFIVAGSCTTSAHSAENTVGPMASTRAVRSWGRPSSGALGLSRAFLHTGSGPLLATDDLGTLWDSNQPSDSRALGINDSGDVVGFANISNGANRCLLLQWQRAHTGFEQLDRTRFRMGTYRGHRHQRFGTNLWLRNESQRPNRRLPPQPNA